MPALSHHRGWPAYFDEDYGEGGGWLYTDTKEPITMTRKCKHCGLTPLADQHDPCLGELPGVHSACCGHGVRGGHITIQRADGTFLHISTTTPFEVDEPESSIKKRMPNQNRRDHEENE